MQICINNTMLVFVKFQIKSYYVCIIADIFSLIHGMKLFIYYYMKILFQVSSLR